ncbi:MAG: hypothetical protein V1918_08155 [Planctomycetota bacterium]
MKPDRIMGFLLGVIVALLLVWVLQRAPATVGHAQAADGGIVAGTGLIVTAVQGQMGDDKNLLWVVDAANHRVAVYEYETNDSKILLKAARNMRFDLVVNTEINAKKGLSFEQIRRGMQ